MNQDPQVRQAIRLAMQTEKDAMDFYLQVARHFSDPETSCRFARFAREERQHAYSFFTLYRGDDIPSFEDFLAAPPRADSAWWAALRRLEGEGFSEQGALRLALERERILEAGLRQAAAGMADPEVRAIYLANATSTHHHCRCIEQQYAEKYGAIDK